MKFLTLISAFLYLSTEVLSRRARHHNRGPCDKGTKGFNAACKWKICGSECSEGLACLRNGQGDATVCKKEFLQTCSGHTDCGWDAYCDPNDHKCHYLPFGTTQADLNTVLGSGSTQPKRRRRKY
jgi:hypothetical protein